MGNNNRTDITGKTDNISMIYKTSKQYSNKDMKMSEYILVKKDFLEWKNRRCTRNCQVCKEIKKSEPNKKETFAYDEVLNILKMRPMYELDELAYIPIPHKKYTKKSYD